MIELTSYIYWIHKYNYLVNTPLKCVVLLVICVLIHFYVKYLWIYIK